MHTILAPMLIAVTLTSSSDNQASRAKDLPQAFIMSKHVVYGHDQPIDLAFSIVTPEEGEVLPDFKIVNEAGEPAEPREVDGLRFWEAAGESVDGKTRDGALPAGETFTEVITDLREWYDMSAPGTYRITFEGRTASAKEGERADILTSNTIVVRVARPPLIEGVLDEAMEGRAVPLGEIWALDLPGTKPMQRGMRQVDPPIYWAPEGRYISDIRQEVTKAERLREPAPRVFVVHGSGLQALHEARAVLVGERQATRSVRRGEVASLVFVSHAQGDRLEISSVMIYGDVVEIVYKFMPRSSMGISWHLALIPVQFEQTGTVHLYPRPIAPDDALLASYGKAIREHMPRFGTVEIVE